ncbi:MAG: IPT/TIG domain-containing protein [Chitinophagaceae bacterium]|nr:IPT/TIG domain-containing protein [Chitinophagaceae bacterium]
MSRFPNPRSITPATGPMRPHRRTCPNRSLFYLCLLLLTVIGCQKNPVPPTPAPAVSAINPSSGYAGTLVTITGNNFSTTASDNTVKFNGVAATVNSASATSLVVVAPSGATTGNISVTTSGGTASGPVFTYIVVVPPAVSSISPISGAANTIVTINGSNFKTTPTDNTVKFNGVAATVQTATATTLTVLAPSAGTTGAITVTTVDGTATGPTFTYVVAQNVYVVGRSSSGPAYWVNGVRTDMPSDCLEANAIFVDGADIYIAGADANGPKYWKNGAGVSLPMTAGHNGGRAKSIFVSGSDVYICGYDMINGAYALPRCWKNGTALTVSLSSGNISAGLPVVLGFAYSVFVSGADVYLAGSQAPSSGNQVVTYWKNGTPFPLTDGTTVAEAKSVFVSGNDVYLAGFIQGAATSAYYWKNGTAVPLTINTTSSNCTPESIYVSSTGDVYVSGEVRYLAKYWKNGGMYDLTTTTPGNGISEPAFSITGNGPDIYIAGTATGQGTGYWKNGNFNVLPAAQYVYGIVIK